LFIRKAKDDAGAAAGWKDFDKNYRKKLRTKKRLFLKRSQSKFHLKRKPKSNSVDIIRNDIIRKYFCFTSKIIIFCKVNFEVSFR